MGILNSGLLSGYLQGSGLKSRMKILAMEETKGN